MVFISVFVIFVLYGVRNKIFSDIDVSNGKQRPILYFIGALLSVLYLFSLFILQGPMILFITTFGIILGILLAGLINMKVKASMHVAAFSGLISSLSIVYRGYYLLLLFLIPVIAWSRVKIKRHTVPEVIIGGTLGSLLSLIMYFTTKFFIHT
jgi:putative transposase